MRESYTHTICNIHTHTHTLIHTHIHLHTHAYIHTYTHTHTHTPTQTGKKVYAFIMRYERALEKNKETT